MSAESKKEAVILFAGDSGDGIQLTGGQFTETAGLFGNDISTFPTYPSEIRAPKGSLGGVSGFQLKFGSDQVFTPGDNYDVLVAMNAAALKVSIKNLNKGGTIIVNTDGFDSKSLRMAGYAENPLEDQSLSDFYVNKIAVTKLTRTALVDSGLGAKEIDRCKNMLVLGFIYWMYNRPMDYTINFLKEKFHKKPEIRDANISALKTGYNLADTKEVFYSRYNVERAPMPKGVYRNVKGNEATALGLIAAAEKANLNLFYGSYPITPATDILHFLSRHKNFGVKTFQAEDEIAGVASAIGASFGGSLAATASSGPGIALKGEALGLAVILELPLVVVNVQRGGPSTGLPTKTEQSDLFQALYGRHGEAPMPVIAGCSPSDCFDAAFEASRIAIEHMTPVILLTDGYIANGSEPWNFPSAADLPSIQNTKPLEDHKSEDFLPYLRNDKFVRPWAVPGLKGFEHRIGGLEKELDTGNVSYDPDNHAAMTKVRQAKIDMIADTIPPLKVYGDPDADILVLGWGSTYGAITTAIKELNEEGLKVASVHLRHLNPLPKDLEGILKRHRKVIIPEMNTGQLAQLIRGKYLVDAERICKVRGLPFTVAEIKTRVTKEYEYTKQ